MADRSVSGGVRRNGVEVGSAVIDGYRLGSATGLIMATIASQLVAERTAGDENVARSWPQGSIDQMSELRALGFARPVDSALITGRTDLAQSVVMPEDPTGSTTASRRLRRRATDRGAGGRAARCEAAERETSRRLMGSPWPGAAHCRSGWRETRGRPMGSPWPERPAAGGG